MKKALSILLATLLLLTMLPLGAVSVSAATSGLTLSQLRQKFPHGKYWNGGNANSYTSSPCNHHGSCSYNGSCGCNSFLGLSIQCMGYAEKLGYDATGYNPRNNANGWYTYTSSSALDSLKPGDIVRYKNGGHSIYITGVNGDTVTYTDCNSDGHCIIRWDVTISKSTLRSSFSYVRSAPSSVSPGSTSCSCSTSYSGTYICTTSSLNLTIRSGHGSSYSDIGSIPPGATVTVSKASGTSSSDWAHVTYNGVTGYASMQYLSKKKPTQQRNSQIGLWLSDSEMGGSISTIRTGEWLYLCYKLYDSNTGDLLDTYNTSGGYTAKLTLYETNGAVAHTYTYTNDNNWISIRRATPGKYKGELVFTWNSGGTVTTTVSINMVYEPRVTPSVSDIQLNVNGASSQTISISYSGATSSNSIYLSCTTSGNCFDYEWGSWSDHKKPLTITGARAGEGVITIKMHDADTDQVIATAKVYVTVNCSHSYGAATCTKPKSCKYCGITSGSALGHKYDNDCDKYCNTCGLGRTVSGHAYSYACDANCNICGASRSVGIDDHDFYTEVAAEATCVDYGKKYHICADCGYSISEPILPTGKHVYTNDCDTTCNVCNATRVVTHNYTSKVTKQPTCTATGVKTYTCTTCKHSYIESVVALGHSWNDATCTAPKICKVCGITSGEALGHNYNSVVNAPTCTSGGYTTYSCTACGDSYFADKVAALGHSYVDATCIVPKTCRNCGITYGDALGHYWCRATCTDPKTCLDCGATSGKALGHKYTNTCDTSCNVCKATRTITHKYSTVTKKATTTANGYTVKRCSVCDKETGKKTLYKVSSVTLSKTSYTYNGKVQKPTVTVKNANGVKLTEGTSYTVTYSSGCKNAGTYKVTIKLQGNYSGTVTKTFKINPVDVSKCKITLSATSYTYNGAVKKPTVTVKNAAGTKLTEGGSYTVTYATGRKNVGTYKVTVKMKGNYTGTKTITFKILPTKTSISSLTAGTKKLTVKWAKKTTQVTGYQIQYSTSKTFSSAKTKTITKNSTVSTALTGLSAKKTYYVRIRTYKTVNGVKIYSGWSTVKSLKTK